MRSPILAVAVALTALATTVAAQSRVESDLFVADRGNAMNGSDGEVRRYTFDGAFVSTLPAAGSGAIRALEVDPVTGDVYVARGNDLLRYASPALTPDPAPIVSGTRVQNVAVHPTTGNLWVGFGATPSEAEIREVMPDGTVLQTITSSLLEQPRSLAFDEAGDLLLVANVTGQNVLALDVTVTPPTVSVYGDMATLGFSGMAPIGIARDPSRAVSTFLVTGDFLTTTSLVLMEGATVATGASAAVNYGSAPDFRAAGGPVIDSWGNAVVACRSQNMAVPGTYVFRLSDGVRPRPASTGMENVNPIDVAFLRRDLTLEIQDGGENEVFDVNGNAAVVVGDTEQPSFRLVLDAPDYPNSAYAILYSLAPADAGCELGPPARPLGGSGIPIVPGDSRRFPLALDELYIQSQQLLFQAIDPGGLVPMPLPASLGCATSIPGQTLFLFGVTDAMGHAETFVDLPTFPDACFPPVGFSFRIAYAAAVLDGFTGPLGIGLVSGAPTCLEVLYFAP